MTLQDATERAKRALDAGDIAELAAALVARRQAIQSGEPPTPEIVDAGESLLLGLRGLQRQAAYDSARLDQIRCYLEFRK